MTPLAFTAVCVVCFTAIFIAVGVLNTLEKIHRKDK